jgi:hypothetical protein
MPVPLANGIWGSKQTLPLCIIFAMKGKSGQQCKGIEYFAGWLTGIPLENGKTTASVRSDGRLDAGRICDGIGLCTLTVAAS